jgi:putative membrane-bound dehydrogenase-like protein
MRLPLGTVLLGFGLTLWGQGLPAGPEEHVALKDYRQGLSPEQAIKTMSLPKGFQVSLVAAEPAVVQPIAMCFDERGRLWVVEGMCYPNKRPDGQGQDRILILEDVKGDGSYAKRTVFMEGLNLVSGIEVGYGGVWIGAAPEFIFIPKDAQDHPGKPQVLLDGWGYQDTHETLNSFTWGPDGWLYGCHGVFTSSKVGVPGTPENQRTKINAGVFRYHPTQHRFEVFAEGTSNPWGLDFNDRGEMFITACVIPHLYHILPGARYQRQAGQHFELFTFDDIKTIADHAHFTGAIVHRPAERGIVQPDSTDAAGGGHAHCGLCIYQGDNFPPAYQGLLMFGNLHGHRVLCDQVEAVGSGYVGHHAGDFMRSNDAYFIPVSQRLGPDGALYVSDWTDKQTCHNNNTQIWDRTNGRIYRVSYGNPVTRQQNLAQLSDDKLATILLDDRNDYFSRMARKVLSERAAERVTMTSSATATLVEALRSKKFPVTRRLRALWALQCTQQASPDLLEECLQDADFSIRTWGVRLMAQQHPELSDKLLAIAVEEPSAVVHRELASALSYLPLKSRAALAMALVRFGEDAQDHNIPLLLWYGIEPVVGADPEVGLTLARQSRLPKVTDYIYRRLAVEPKGRSQMLTLAASTEDALVKERLVEGVVIALRQGGDFIVPEHWEDLVVKLKVGASTSLLNHIAELNALAGDAASLAVFRSQLLNQATSLSVRQRALMVLVHARDRAATEVLHQVLEQPALATALRRGVIQALGTLGQASTPDLLIRLYKNFSAEEASDALGVLVLNPNSGLKFLQAVQEGVLPRAVLSPVVLRQLKGMHDTRLDQKLNELIGVVNQSKPDMLKLKAKYVEILKPEALRKADVKAGKALFQTSCGLCHQLFGEGPIVGPVLTGSNRTNLDYLLENVLDPNAIIGKDYQLNVFKLQNGNTVSGILQSEDAEVYHVALPAGVKVEVKKKEVNQREILAVSLMPEGLFDALTPTQVINLVAYLQSPDGVKLPAVAQGGAPVWRVEGALEGESMKVLAQTGGKAVHQSMSNFKESRWSGDDQLWWTGAKVGDTLTLALPIKENGQYQLTFVCTKAHDYGRFAISIDGKAITDQGLDLYHAQGVVTTGELDGGRHELTAGEHRLEIKVLMANPLATPQNMFGLDFIKVEKK